MAPGILFATWKAELQGLHGFLVNLGTKAEAAKHTGQVINRLKLVQGFTAEHASEAVTLISSGPWPEEQKTQLTTAVSETQIHPQNEGRGRWLNHLLASSRKKTSIP